MGLKRNWGTANQGWVDVDPSGNKMNRKAAEKQAKEDAKWQEMTKEDFDLYKKGGGRVYGLEQLGGGKFRVKTER